MKLTHYAEHSIILMTGVLLCTGEWSYDSPVAYTVYNVQKTWNEAKDICYANNRTMLSMANDTIWKFWWAMLKSDSSVPHRTTSRFWFGLHSANASNLSELYWDDCRVPGYIEWTVNRPSYKPNYPCLGFDLYFKPYAAAPALTIWLAISCAEQNRFICKWENDCLYQTCEEFIMITSDTDCNTACTILNSIGDVTDLASCRSRLFVLVDFSVCHVHKIPSSVTAGESFNICYKPAINIPMNYCTNTQPIIDIGSFVNPSPIPNSTCRKQNIQTTTITTYLEETTKSMDPQGMCECPCTTVSDSTDTPLTVEERIEILKKELTIDKKQTSNSKRKLISASDDRQSAKNLGVFGLSILIVVPVCILMMDLSSIGRHFKFCVSKDMQIDKINLQNKSERSFLSEPQCIHEDSVVDRKRLLGNTPQRLKDGKIDSVSQQENDGNMASRSVLSVCSKTHVNPKTKVIYKDILDIRYQPSMIASRVLASDIKSGKRMPRHDTLVYQGKDIGEEVRVKSSKTRKQDGISWVHML